MTMTGKQHSTGETFIILQWVMHDGNLYAVCIPSNRTDRAQLISAYDLSVSRYP